MHAYLNLLKKIMNKGVDSDDRTGTGTRKLFAQQLRFDLQEGFPILSTKYVHFKSVKTELLWFLKGDTNTKFLHDHKVTIWDEWADDDGDLGPIYGAQWRHWPAKNGLHIDQIVNVIDSLKNDPNGRRHIVNAWNVGELHKMALPPCHLLFQFMVHDGVLSCHLTMRSADMFLGVPFNIASYGLLTHLIARECGYDVGELVVSMTDCHIYKNHFQPVNEQISRPVLYNFTELVINEAISSIFDLEPGDIKLNNYKHQGKINAPVAV